MKQVKKISHEGAAALVQWLDSNGTLCRGIVPSLVLEEIDGVLWADSSELDASIPYGDPLEEILPSYDAIHKAALVNELHRRNVWTVDELLANHEAVRGAVLTAFNLRGILQRAREYQRR